MYIIISILMLYLIYYYIIYITCIWDCNTVHYIGFSLYHTITLVISLCRNTEFSASRVTTDGTPEVHLNIPDPLAVKLRRDWERITQSA